MRLLLIVSFIFIRSNCQSGQCGYSITILIDNRTGKSLELPLGKDDADGIQCACGLPKWYTFFSSPSFRVSLITVNFQIFVCFHCVESAARPSRRHRLNSKSFELELVPQSRHPTLIPCCRTTLARQRSRWRPCFPWCYRTRGPLSILFAAFARCNF